MRYTLFVPILGLMVPFSGANLASDANPPDLSATVAQMTDDQPVLNTSELVVTKECADPKDAKALGAVKAEAVAEAKEAQPVKADPKDAKEAVKAEPEARPATEPEAKPTSDKTKSILERCGDILTTVFFDFPVNILTTVFYTFPAKVLSEISDFLHGPVGYTCKKSKELMREFVKASYSGKTSEFWPEYKTKAQFRKALDKMNDARVFWELLPWAVLINLIQTSKELFGGIKIAIAMYRWASDSKSSTSTTTDDDDEKEEDTAPAPVTAPVAAL